MKTKIELHIIQEIRKRRIEKGFTQESLSYALNKNRTYIASIENGTRKYNVNLMNEIAQIFRCAPKDFLPDHPLF